MYSALAPILKYFERLGYRMYPHTMCTLHRCFSWGNRKAPTRKQALRIFPAASYGRPRRPPELLVQEIEDGYAPAQPQSLDRSFC